MTDQRTLELAGVQILTENKTKHKLTQNSAGTWQYEISNIKFVICSPNKGDLIDIVEQIEAQDIDEPDIDFQHAVEIASENFCDNNNLDSNEVWINYEYVK